MIQLRYIRPLLIAKLRAKPGRSAVIVGVSSLLFGIVLAGTTIVNAGIESAQKFSEAAYRGHQFVQADHLRDTNALIHNELIQQQAQSIYDHDVVQMQTMAKKLGIDFDSRTIPEPVKQVPGGRSGDVMLNLSAPSAAQAVAKYKKTHPGIGIKDLKKIADKYSAVSVTPVSGLSAVDGTFSLMRNDKEVYPTASSPVNTSDDFIANSPLRLVDESAIKPFIDSNVSVKDGEIAVVLPYSAAETVIGLDSINNNSNINQKLQRIKKLYNDIVGVNFSVCYRNTISEQQINQALNNTDALKNENAPIVYALPNNHTCDAAEVVKDARSNNERMLDEKKHSFNEQFGIKDSPIQQKLTFKVIGLVPDDVQAENSLLNSPISVVRLLLGPSLLGKTTLSTQAYSSLPTTTKELFNLGAPTRFNWTDSYLVEFSSVYDARRFIEDQSCDSVQEGSCQSSEHPFILSSFGSGGVALANLSDATKKPLNYAVGVIMAIAVVIMAGIFGKIIADEKHEIAIFRAVGATRRDITLIYISYALLLSLFAAAIAVIIGLSLALIAHIVFAGNLTSAMRLTYSVFDDTISVNLVIFNVFNVLVTIAVIMATSILSIVIPLQSSIKRNVIKDLKND